MLSTFTQISAEVEGRSYGGGILKHEIGEASSIQLLLPSSVSQKVINDTFEKIDQYLRLGLSDQATIAADTFLRLAMPKLVSKQLLRELGLCLKHLRRYRKPLR
jgi:hypothetical protein